MDKWENGRDELVRDLSHRIEADTKRKDALMKCKSQSEFAKTSWRIIESLSERMGP